MPPGTAGTDRQCLKTTLEPMENTSQYDFGMVGIGVMGRNLLLNMADHGFSVIGLDTYATKAAALEG